MRTKRRPYDPRRYTKPHGCPDGEERQCLKCLKPFWSLHIGNRMCNGCKKHSEAYAVTT